MPYLRMRDGAQVYVRLLGRGEPCTLLHGFGMHSAHWLPLIWPYLRRYRFILPDLRGFGRSHRTPFNQADVLRNFAEDLEDILDQLGIEQTRLGGVSMGAYTGLQFHRLGGFDRVKAYLHIDQSPQCLNRADWQYGLFGDRQDELLGRFQEVLADIQRFDRRQRFQELPNSLRQTIWEQFGEFFAQALHHPVQQALARRLTQIEPLSQRFLPTENWHAYVDCFRAYLEQDYDMRADLAAMNTPLTVMVGMRSSMYPYPGQFFMHEQVAGSRLVRFEHSGHALMYTEPRKFVRELGRFLKQPNQAA